MKFNKIGLVIFLSFITILSLSFTGRDRKNLPQKQTLKRIVIDAGHGGPSYLAGKFYGASGPHAEEKDITLQIALKLEKEINLEMPDVEVVMTRTTDIFDSPIVKANKANAAKGDLFISIHCNDVSRLKHSEIVGYTTKTVKRKGKKITKKIPQYHTWTTPNPAHGTETYLWGVGKTNEKEEALSENDFVDTTLIKSYDESDPTRLIALSLKTQQYAERSRNLAYTVEEEFEKAGRLSRGAKQRDEKGIWVLQAVAMPAILIEVGFLSYPDEEAYLISEQGQQETAETIVKALKRYRFSLENKQNSNPKISSQK
jgi:N-acetylmuramoyl-L-alanine amidase